MSFENFLWLLLGTMLAVGVMLFPAKEAALARGDFIFLVTAGIPVSAALILPGISVSHFLLVLGLYESLIESIKNVEIGFLLPLGVGVALGTVLFCRLLERLLDGYPRQSCLVILGFIAGTVGEIIPMPADLTEGVICILAALGGFVLISKSRKKSSLHC